MRRNKLTKFMGLSLAAVLAFSSMTVCAAQDSVYTTQRGDNLSKIAQKAYGDKTRWKDIYEANKDVIKDPNLIWANQQLIIPGGVVENTQPVPQDMPATWPEATPEWQAAKASGQSYVEQNGLAFYQGPSFQTQGTRYDADNVERYEFTVVDGVINGIMVRNAEKDGSQVVAISSARNGFSASYDWGENTLSYITVPSILLCDIYTGKVLPNAATDGDVELVNTTNLTWEGLSYSIDYIQDIQWEWDDWSEYDDDGNAYAFGTANQTQTVVIPKGYDGLALLIVPDTEAPSADVEYNVFDNETETYIMDKWKEGSYLIRVSDLYNILNQ